MHGAYADGSSWSEVIERLQGAGLTATAVQNPLTSLADDVAHTRRVLTLQDGPTILTGHSFAGTVITEAGLDPHVAGLVYVAARAPDAGEDYAALAKRFPEPRRCSTAAIPRRDQLQVATARSCPGAPTGAPGHPGARSRDPGPGKDLQHGPVSLPGHVQLPKHERDHTGHATL